MIIKTSTALVAAFLITSVSGALAFDGPMTAEELNYLNNPNAPIPQYQQNRKAPGAFAAPGASQGRLIEGRNLGVQRQMEDDYHRSLRSENSPAT